MSLNFVADGGPSIPCPDPPPSHEPEKEAWPCSARLRLPGLPPSATFRDPCDGVGFLLVIQENLPTFRSDDEQLEFPFLSMKPNLVTDLGTGT